MKIIGKTTFEKEFDSTKEHRIWVIRLCGDDYRVYLFERYNAHNTEYFDLRLNYKKARRYLEEYVKDVAANCNLISVSFCYSVGSDHYSLSRFKELYGDWRGMKYINDINL